MCIAHEPWLNRILRAQAQTAWRHSPYFKPVALFLLFEVPYLIFATCAQVYVIALPGTTDGHALFIKGIFNVVFIAWQALALIPIYGIVNLVYSSEWRYSYRRDGIFVSGRTDSVSKLTSGWLLRARYVASRSSSVICRLSFLVALLGTVLAGVGPSAISVLSWTNVEYSPLAVANLTLASSLIGDSNSPAVMASRRALDIIRTERTLARSYGFDLDTGKFANYLIPWPAGSWTRSLSAQLNITYATDIVRFTHDCNYYEPVWNAAHGAESALFDGESSWTVPAYPGHTWSPWVVSELPSATASGLFPLSEPSLTNNSHGVSAYLFLAEISLSCNRGLSTSLAYPRCTGRTGFRFSHLRRLRQMAAICRGSRASSFATLTYPSAPRRSSSNLEQSYHSRGSVRESRSWEISSAMPQRQSSPRP